MELLSGSDVEKFEEFLNAKRTSRENQEREGTLPAPIAPLLTEMEADHRCVIRLKTEGKLRDPAS